MRDRSLLPQPMSPSGRYQSRLFSFFSRQSLRLKDKADQAWRQAKLAAVWSTQIALYPVYAVFQTGRLLGRQMGQATRQVFPRLQAVKWQVLNPSEPNSLELIPAPSTLCADTPIQNLLAENRRESLASLIQGFASLLSNRELVLVTAENELLDVLTKEQQIQLQRQIIWEMASYWRQYKSQSLLKNRTQLQGWASTFLPLPQERTHLLPPIRSFRRLMTWMQLSPVAIAINLFQESRLPHLAMSLASAPTFEGGPLRSAQLPGSRIDQLMHDLWNNRSPQLPFTAWVKRRANGLTEFSKSLGGFLQNSSLVLYDPLPKSKPEDSLVSPLVSSPLPRKAWLKIEDFFGGKLLGMTDSRQIVRHGAATQSGELGGAIGGSCIENIVSDSVNELTLRPSFSALDQPPRSDGGIASTILEAEVTGVSYEKHPLEQVLKWLDQGMLWIEQKLGQVWRWMYRS